MVSSSRRALAGAGLCLVVAVSPSEAAVLLCSDFVTGDTAREAVERTAKMRALQSWTAKAKALNENAAWHVATDKALTCLRAEDGRFECVARGYPCTTRYVVPDDAAPMDKRGDRRGP